MYPYIDACFLHAPMFVSYVYIYVYIYICKFMCICVCMSIPDIQLLLDMSVCT